MSGTLGPEGISTGLQRVAELSRKAPGMVWSTLSHHITLDLLKEAYRLTHRCHILEANGESYRLRQARKRSNWKPSPRKDPTPKEKDK